MELVALTEACKQAEGKTANIYTDSRYAFGVTHDFGKIWKNRGFMTSLGAPVKNGPEVMALLNALQLPGQVAILKMKAHGKIFTDDSKGNDLADRAAKAAAKRTPLSPKLMRRYTLDTLQHIRDMQSSAPKDEVWEWMAAGCKLSQEGVWKYNLRCVAPNALLPYLVTQIHSLGHIGVDKIVYRFVGKRWNPGVRKVAEAVVLKITPRDE